HIQHQQDNLLKVIEWIEKDVYRMEALKVAATLSLPDWCLAGGFVRNMVWDQLHKINQPTPLNDIDLIYFDPDNIDPDNDVRFENHLREICDLPWSVKNQARMHIRNDDPPYTSTCDAMSYWVEVETAIGAKLSKSGNIEIITSFGLSTLFDKNITINQKRMKPDEFHARILSKNWLKIWPGLKVRGPTYFEN
ncbi:MAG: nucleotidyltransferase family protein, partial [Emcibacteraceae bacterium]|nr:nucleotidyltransferase family protein [Emcibacteraceae bacterium]